MSETLLRVSQAILLVGPAAKARAPRDTVLEAADVPWSTFRSAARELGARQASPGLAFFDTSQRGRLAFGPGAGLAVGVSVGAETVRAVLVDANGWEHYRRESEPLPDQLAAEPAVVVRRITDTVAEVIDSALTGDSLPLVDGALPMLGCAVAWPTPIDRGRKPVGHALAHNSWRSGQSLDQRVEVALGIEGFRSYALNDAHAAAIAIAHRETHLKHSLRWSHPMLTIVIRLAGNVGGAVIVLEPPRKIEATGRQLSGFLNSTLVGGVDNMAGEVGHVPISPSTIERLDADRPDDIIPLAAQRCSCCADHRPLHLEAFASVLALTKRVDPKGERRSVLKAIIEEPECEPQMRALHDIGQLVGDTLVGAVRVLNPAKIIMTGSLALPIVLQQIKDRVKEAHSFGTIPSVTILPKREEDDFVRAKGAALALIRNEVHRNLAMLMDTKKNDIQDSLTSLTVRLSSNPLRKT